MDYLTQFKVPQHIALQAFKKGGFRGPAIATTSDYLSPLLLQPSTHLLPHSIKQITHIFIPLIVNLIQIMQ
jgi:hypothetical protein